MKLKPEYRQARFTINFITKSFQKDGLNYKIIYTPELLPSASGLAFTGNFLGITLNAE